MPDYTIFQRAAQFALMAVFLYNAPLQAADALDNPKTQATISKVQKYLSGLTTAQARFVQVNPDGSYFEGDMYIKRPGRMRFEYDPPAPILLISDGLFLIHVDTELESASRVPVASTPAYFLLQEDVDFSKNTTVTRFSHEAGIIRLELKDKKNPDAGSLTLALNDNPMRLRQWVVLDPQQLKTTITLINPEFGLRLKPELFIYNDPHRKWLKHHND